MGMTRSGIELLFGPKPFGVTECGAEDLRLGDPIGEYMLRAFFHDHPTAGVRGFMLQLLLRSEMANIEYSAGCHSLSEFLVDPIARTLHYFHAVYHFTASIGQAWQFIDLNRSKHEQRTAERINVYKPNDESIPERMNKLSNVSKHAAAEYETMEQPIWITNTGVASELVELSFRELRDSLEAISKVCFDFCDPDYLRKRADPNEE